MRLAPVALVLAACADPIEAPAIRHESTLQQQTRGLVLHDDGLRGHAGMFATNCPFETVRGSVTGDYDLPDEDEEVQDGGESTMGPETVVLGLSDVVWMLEKSTGDYVKQEVRWDGIRQARLTSEGLAGLVDTDGGCAVEWQVGDEVVGRLPLESCDRGFDAAWDETVVVGGDPVVIGLPDGSAIETEEAGRLVAWDDVLGLAYVARPDGDEVAAVRPDGTRAWKTTVDGGVKALAAAGAQAAAVVTLQRDDGTGAIAWLDGASGAVLSELATPSPAPAVTASKNGRRLALVLDGEAHFYSVDLDALGR